MKEIFVNLAQSLCIAFAMYSKIPCPRVDWTKKAMRWSMCFFPLVGVVIGVVVNLWFMLAQKAGWGVLFRSCVLVAIPILITGGIHMDGFLDTTDALSSWKPKEDKLRILKDSNAGAFAVIACGVYLVLQLGAFSEASEADLRLIGLGYILSRSWSALAVVRFPKATGTGLVKTFSDAAVNRTVTVTMLLYIAAVSAAMILRSPLRGSVAAGVCVLVFWWYYRMSLSSFGGITGDLAGYFLQICELAILLAVVL